MKMRQLEAFYAVVTSGTLTKASENLFTSQPSISRMLTDLEMELGFSLLNRKKGRVEVTAEGFAFFEELKKVYIGIDHLTEFAKSIRNQRTSHLTVTVTPALSLSFLPETLARFRQRYPDTIVTALVRGPYEILDQLKEETTDVVLSISLPRLPNTTERLLKNADFVCALPPEHPLKSKDIITSDDIPLERFIMPSPETGHTWKAHDKLFSSMKNPPQIVSYVQRSAIAYGLVLKGEGVSILEPFSAPYWEKLGVHIRPFKPCISYAFYAYFPNGKIRSPLAQELADLAKELAEEQL